jgi:hypothetical protein
MRFINALDAIFRLVVAWKLFDNFENTPWHKPNDRRVDGHDISDLELAVAENPAACFEPLLRAMS